MVRSRRLVISMCLLLLAVLVRLAVRAVLKEMQAISGDVRLESLFFAIVGGVVGFAYTDFLFARWRPGEFVGIATRTGALYFALTTLTAVGYGDIHLGQLGRGLVVAQMLFNLVVVASGANLFVREIKAQGQRNLT